MPLYCGISDPNDEVGAVSGHLVNVYKEVQQGPVAHPCGTPVLRVIVTNTQLPQLPVLLLMCVRAQSVGDGILHGPVWMVSELYLG